MNSSKYFSILTTTVLVVFVLILGGCSGGPADNQASAPAPEQESPASYEQKTETLTTHVQNLKLLYISAQDKYQAYMMEVGKHPGQDVVLAVTNGEREFSPVIDELHTLFEQAVADSEAIAELIPPIAGKSKEAKDFANRWRAANEIALATQNFIAGLEAAVHFNYFGFVQEGQEHEMLASKALNEIALLRRQYFQEGIPNLPETKKPKAKKNVFVILMDAARAADFGTFGYTKYDTTPFIDKLASEGLVFDKAFSQASHTDVSVASLMTAMYPNGHKLRRSSDWLYERSLIEQFRKAGFTTSGFSANVLIDKEAHFDYGHDYFEDVPYGRSRIVFNRALRHIDQLQTRTGVFMYIHLIDPHDLYLAQKPFDEMFDPGYKVRMTSHLLHRIINETFPKIAAEVAECNYNPYFERWDQPEQLLKCINLIPEMGDYDMREIENMHARYDGELRYIDFELERFTKELERRNMLNDAMIVVVADHGEAFLEHNVIGHGQSVIEHLINVPMIFWKSKDKLGGKRISDPVEIIDTFPTLMGLLNIQPPKGLHGRNLLANKKDVFGTKIFSSSYNALMLPERRNLTIFTVRDWPFKYVLTLNSKADGFIMDELHKLDEDPDELTDVKDQYPEKYEELKAAIEDWREKTKAKKARETDETLDEKKIQKMKDLGYLN